MKIIKLLQESIDAYLSDGGQARASNGFELLANGRKPTPRSPLFRDRDVGDIFTEWTGFLSQVGQSDPVLQPLVEYDLSRITKVGPQGGYRPFSEREDDFAAYYTSPDESIDTGVISENTISKCQEICFGNIRGRRPLTVESVVKADKYDDKLLTNSGCTEYTRRDDPSTIAKATKEAKSGGWKNLPFILGSRAQRGAERFIFMAAFALNLIEKTYLYPIMEAIRQEAHPFFSAWEGFDQVELGLAEMKFFSEDNVYITQDYEKMDKHVNTTQMLIGHKVTSSMFQDKFVQLWKEILDYVLIAPVLIQLDKLVTGLHGMPSGAGVTNLIETIISLYIYIRYGEVVTTTAGMALGDDMIFAVKRETNSDDEILDVMTTISKEVGQVLNPEKQRIDGHTIVFLQRFFDDRIPNSGIVRGMYPSILALNTAMHPERFHDARKWSKEMEILRWIMILENCKNLPYYHELIQFFMKGDKYKLGTIIPGFFKELPLKYEESKAIKGFVPSYNQEGLNRGIYDFETVKYLQAIADS